MATLKDTQGWRGGRSTNRRKRTGEVTLHSASILSSVGRAVELRLSMSVTSGFSEVNVIIGKEDYAAVLETMTRVDRETALFAMASELAKNLQIMVKERDEERAASTLKFQLPFVPKRE